MLVKKYKTMASKATSANPLIVESVMNKMPYPYPRELISMISKSVYTWNF